MKKKERIRKGEKNQKIKNFALKLLIEYYSYFS